MKLKSFIRGILSGGFVTLMLCSSSAEAADVVVFNRAAESFQHYVTENDISEKFLTENCKIGDIVVLADWSSFVFRNHDWGFVELGLKGLNQNEWLKISEEFGITVDDAKRKAETDYWLILKAVD